MRTIECKVIGCSRKTKDERGYCFQHIDMYKIPVKPKKRSSGLFFKSELEFHDSRTNKPSSSSYGEYLAIVDRNGSIIMENVAWVPNDGYTDGNWYHLITEGKAVKHTKVLYWSKLPSVPLELKNLSKSVKIKK